MKTIADAFAKTFADFEIVLPADDVVGKRAGFVNERGWLIQYCFGSDEAGEYLDYYASHRMTEDSHLRLRADGRTEALPAIVGMHLTSSDPAEAKRLDEEHLRRNREVAGMLAKKGFDKFTLNMALRSGLAT